MKVLTIHPNETWIEMVQRIALERHARIPTDGEADFILWNRTAFPFTSAERIAEQIDRVMVEATS